MTITNFQIIDICKRYNIPLNGVFNKDQLPLRENRRQGGCVLNLQDDEDSSGNDYPGSHWCCFFIEKDNCVYFDSYGIIFPRQVREFSQGLHLIHSTKMIQSEASVLCGSFCILFLFFMSRQKHIRKLENRMKAFNSMFYNDTKRNDQRLKDILKQYNLTFLDE